MDFCAVILVVSLCKVSMSAPSKFENTEVLEKTLQSSTYLVEMSKDLTSISKGDPNVSSANYGYNNIVNLPAYVFSDNGFLLLERIQLNHNQITCLNPKAFRKLDNLNSVDLSDNNITGLDVNTFKTNTKLERLDLTANRIRFKNRPFLNSQSMTTLIMSDNRIDQIFQVNFSKLPNLRNLILNSNIIFCIDDNSFAPIFNLVYLSLAHTGVYRLGEEMFKNGSYPKIIDVTDTPLGNQFNPPLTKVKNDGVIQLINIDNYF